MCGMTSGGDLVMSQGEFDDAIRRASEDAVRKIMAEHEAARLATGASRAPFSTLKDPDGKTWVSSTFEKAEVVKKFWQAILLVCAIGGGINYALTRYIVTPEATRVARETLTEHEVAVAKKMDAIMPTIVMRSDFDKYVERRDERWVAQGQTNERIETALVEVSRDIKELLKRTR